MLAGRVHGPDAPPWVMEAGFFMTELHTEQMEGVLAGLGPTGGVYCGRARAPQGLGSGRHLTHKALTQDPAGPVGRAHL